MRERLDVSVEDAFVLLRRYARSNDEHLTDVSRRLIAQCESRPAMLAALAAISTSPA